MFQKVPRASSEEGRGAYPLTEGTCSEHCVSWGDVCNGSCAFLGVRRRRKPVYVFSWRRVCGPVCQFSQRPSSPPLSSQLLQGRVAGQRRVVGDDFIPVELGGGQHSLFYGPFPFRLRFSPDSKGAA